MTEYPLIRFVDDPSTDADVRLDLNPHGYKSELSIGAPEFSGDPDSINAQLGLRRVSFVFYVDGDKSFAREQQSKLARELMRSRNWLMFQLSPSSPPCWFRTYRSSNVDVSFEHVHSATEGDFWSLPLEIDADPDIWGELVELPTVTINNNPADDGTFLTLPEIKGDLPAPLRVTLSDYLHDLGFSTLGTIVVTALPPNVVGYDSALRLRAELWSLVWGTTSGAPIDDLIASAVNIPDLAADDSLKMRQWGGELPTVDSSDSNVRVAGRFKVLIRVGRGNVGMPGTFKLRLGQLTQPNPTLDASYEWNDTATIQLDGTEQDRRWVDLGEVQLPFGNPMPDEYVDELATSGRVNLAVQVGQVDDGGIGDISLDDAVLLPVQMPGSPGSTMTVFTSPEPYPTPISELVIDADAQRMLAIELDTDFAPPRPTLLHLLDSGAVVGGFPVAHPGFTNIMHLLYARPAKSLPTPMDRELVDTTDVRIAYHPRWLFLPGGD